MTAACVAGRAGCPGVTGLYFGEMPCPECWVFTPSDAHATFHMEVMAGG